MDEQSFNMGLGIKDFDKDYQNELAYCDKCKEIRIIGPSDTCECGTRLKRIYTMDMLGQNVSGIECPRCGKKMSITPTGLWD